MLYYLLIKLNPGINHTQDDTLLVIGWGTSVKIASIRSHHQKVANGTYRQVPLSGMNQVDIVASFQTTYFISGIAPFGDSLVVLAYIPAEKDGERDFSSTAPSRQVCHAPCITTKQSLIPLGGVNISFYFESISIISCP